MSEAHSNKRHDVGLSLSVERRLEASDLPDTGMALPYAVDVFQVDYWSASGSLSSQLNRWAVR